MPDSILAAYAPPTPEEKQKEWWKTLALATTALVVIVAVGMTVFFLYVAGIKRDFNNDIAGVRKDAQVNTRLNNQGRAAVCFLASTRVNNTSDLPAICHNPDVIKYYNPLLAQYVSKVRDADALKQVVCLIVPTNKQCQAEGP